MFRHLGTFALLAVCLFAIVLVMGGCDGERIQQMLPPPVTPETDAPETSETETGETENGSPKSDPPIVPPTTETPLEKLTGSYTLIEWEIVHKEAEGGEDLVLSPDVGSTGKLHLRPEGNGWSQTINGETLSGPTWSATATTFTIVADSGSTGTEDYILVGDVLTLVYDDDSLRMERSWQKD